MTGCAGCRAGWSRAPLTHPPPGLRREHLHTLRLWSAEAVESFDFQAFNAGDYCKAVEAEVVSETMTKVLYPNDEPEIGKRLRLSQQYFFVSCSLQDMLATFCDASRSLPVERSPESSRSSSTTRIRRSPSPMMRHPAGREALDWDAAWAITWRRSATRTTPCCPRRWRLAGAFV